MKPRKSLAQKLREVAKHGTLQTFSRQVAIHNAKVLFRDNPEYLEKRTTEINNAYDNGKILCSFTAYPDERIRIDGMNELASPDERIRIDGMNELTSPDTFIKDVYFMIS